MKPWLKIALAALAGLVLGIVVAKYTLPPKITERTVTKVETVEVVKWKEKVVIEKGPEKVTTRTVTVPGPAGPTVTVEKIVEKEKIVTVRDNSGASNTATDTSSEHSKITDSRPWLALDFMGAIAPGSNQWAWTGGAQIRVIGPVWVGAGAVKADRWYLGPSARIEF